MAESLYRRLENQYDKSARQVVKKQILEKVRLVEQSLQHLRSLETNGSLAELLQEIQQDIAALKNTADDLDRPFRLFVIGTGNVGKSTLINALIGTEHEYAKTKRLPTTWKIDIYTNRQDDLVELRFADGTTTLYSAEKARQIETDEESNAKAAKKIIAEKIRAIKVRNDLSQKVQEEYVRSIRRKYGYHMKVTEAFWPVSNSEFLQRFQLVDTPGMNQELWGRSIEASAQSYYERADGILWILPADEINEKGSAQEVEKAFQKFHTRMESTIAVVNKMDEVLENNPEHGFDEIAREAERIYGNKFRQICFISAKQAYEGIKEDNQELFRSSGLQTLQDAIRQTFFQRAQEIQLQRIEERVTVGWQMVLEKIHAFRIELQNNLQHYQLLMPECKTQFVREQQLLAGQLDSMFQKTLARVSRNANAYEDKLDDMDETARKSFLQEHVLEYDVLQMDLDVFQQRCVSRLNHLVKAYQEKASFSEYKELEKALAQSTNRELEVSLGIGEEVFSTTGGQAIFGGIAALGAAALLGPVGIAAGLVAATPFGKSVVRMVRGWFGNSLAHDIEMKYQASFEEINKNLKQLIDEKVQEEISYIAKIRDGTFYQRYLAVDKVSVVLKEFQVIEGDAEGAVHGQLKRLTLRDILFGGLEMEE